MDSIPLPLPEQVPYSVSFIERVSSAQAMGVVQRGGRDVLVPTALPLSQAAAASVATYQSPYQMSFAFSWATLTAGLNQPPFNQPARQGRAPFFTEITHWYEATRYQTAQAGSVSWGPAAMQYPPPVVPDTVSSAQLGRWRAERLLAIAVSMVGYGYRHHHVPDWNPSVEWHRAHSPKVMADSPSKSWQWVGKGVDCSNYTAWLFNYGLGIALPGNIQAQARLRGDIRPAQGVAYHVEQVASAEDSDQTLLQRLRPGDLLFIAGQAGWSKSRIQHILHEQGPDGVQVTHVAMWLGDVGLSTHAVPLIIDSHGARVRDENGQSVPSGVQVRPFNMAGGASAADIAGSGSASNWYFQHFVWALRIDPIP